MRYNYNKLKEDAMKKIIKILLQVAIIYLLYIAGNLLSTIISPIINIPGSLMGMVLLFVFLCTNIIKLPMIEEAGNFLLKYMGFFFVPVTAGLIDTFELVQDNYIKLIIILFISCVLVMYVSCKVTDLLIIYVERKR